MVAVDIGAGRVPPVPAVDDLDDLFGNDTDDVFRDVDTNMNVPSQKKAAIRVDGKQHTVGLGIDEEIKLSKKRAPVPKLDEERLLGPAGIPKLRRITRERLKFRGKGHEYSDVTRLLSVYQLWLDELYPRAKFADGLAIIEKLGHTKRIQTMRREWIIEGKPKEHLNSPRHASKKPASKRPLPDSAEGGSKTAVPTKRLKASAVADDENVGFHAETLKEGDVEHISKPANPTTQSLFVSDDEEVENVPSADDLDILLAEVQGNPFSEKPGTSGMEDDFEDELEAMASMKDLY